MSLLLATNAFIMVVLINFVVINSIFITASFEAKTALITDIIVAKLAAITSTDWLGNKFTELSLINLAMSPNWSRGFVIGSGEPVQVLAKPSALKMLALLIQSLFFLRFAVTWHAPVLLSRRSGSRRPFR